MFLLTLLSSLLLSDDAVAKPVAQRVERAYELMIEEERARFDQKTIVERIAGGIAALGIGLYGYYNDDRGTITKVIYSATQTAGVLITSDAIYDANRPSLLLTVDRHLDDKGLIREQRFQRALVEVERATRSAKSFQLAMTSAIIGGIYLYNGYREKGGNKEVSLRNVFYFLGGNFLLVSTANFYQYYSRDSWDLVVGLSPFPTLAINF